MHACTTARMYRVHVLHACTGVHVLHACTESMHCTPVPSPCTAHLYRVHVLHACYYLPHAGVGRAVYISAALHAHTKTTPLMAYTLNLRSLMASTLSPARPAAHQEPEHPTGAGSYSHQESEHPQGAGSYSLRNQSTPQEQAATAIRNHKEQES